MWYNLQRMKRMTSQFASFFTITLWGVSLVSAKYVLNLGVNAPSVFFYRFLIMYVIIAILSFFSREKLIAKTVREELLFALMGIIGGSIYYFIVYKALSFELTSNVSFFIAAGPITLSIFNSMFYSSKLVKSNMIIGILLLLAGLGVVVYNSVRLDINPMGNVLLINATFMWGLYVLLMDYLNQKYSLLFVLRKMTFYGLLTILPFFLFEPLMLDPAILKQPLFIANILFLSSVTMLLMTVLRLKAVQRLGYDSTIHNIYLLPIAAILLSYIFLREMITPLALVGGILIIVGVRIADKGHLRQ